MTEPATTTATPPLRPTVPAFTRLPARSLVAVEGEDALKFLDGLVSGDLDPVAEGRACYGALLTPHAAVAGVVGQILRELLEQFALPAHMVAWLRMVLVRGAPPATANLHAARGSTTAVDAKS